MKNRNFIFPLLIIILSGCCRPIPMSNFQTARMEKGHIAMGVETHNYQFQDYVAHTGGAIQPQDTLDFFKSSSLVITKNAPCTLQFRGKELLPPNIKTEVIGIMYFLYPHWTDPLINPFSPQRKEQSVESSLFGDLLCNFLIGMKIGLHTENDIDIALSVLGSGTTFPPIVFSTMLSGIISKDFFDNKFTPFLRASLYQESGFGKISYEGISDPWGGAISIGNELKWGKKLSIIYEVNYTYFPWYKSYREKSWSPNIGTPSFYPVFGLGIAYDPPEKNQRSKFKH